MTDGLELQERIRRCAADALAQRIRQAKADSGLSHDRIGELMGGVTRQHLIKLEQGKHRPGAEMLERYASATGKPVEFFVSSEGDTNGPFRDAA